MHSKGPVVLSTTPIKIFPRLWSLDDGTAMVVTDLHGDWDAYERYRDRFAALKAKGEADYLIFTGDLIHADDSNNDQSMEIIFDVLALRATYGPAIIYLCGNHELPHIYSFSLARGEHVYTREFEAQLNQSRWRDEILDLFHSLPFYVRTRAGVSLTHAGAPPSIVEPKNGLKLFEWSHQAILNWADEFLARENLSALRAGYSKLNNGLPYETLAKHFLGVSGPDDPRYDHLLRGFVATNHPDFNPLLWPALFTRCEKEYGKTDHNIFVHALLQMLSQNYTTQQLLVTGHVAVKGGHQLVTHQHLRLASAQNARPRQAGQYLLFDTAHPITSIKDLKKSLRSVFR